MVVSRENLDTTYLDLYRSAFKSVVQHGQDLRPDVVTRCLLQNHMEILQQRNRRLDRFWDGEHIPGMHEDKQLCVINTAKVMTQSHL